MASADETDSSSTSAVEIRTPFVHKPLDDPLRQIRLLRILPGHDDELIQCVIAVHDLAEVENKFVAISYAWGMDGDQHEILVNDAAHTVRRSCCYVLSQMRAHNAKQEQFDRLYWLDYICINQEDVQEKNSQVYLMNRIFSRASTVAACIGELDTDFLDLCSLQPLSTYKTLESGLARAKEVRDQLNHRDYFHRLWIVQECSLAKRLIIFCGDRSLPYSAWKERLYHGQWIERQLPFLASGKPPGLKHSILVHGRRACSDLHDKIYGFLALADAEERGLSLDYSQSLWDTLLDFSTTMTLASASDSNTFVTIDNTMKCVKALSQQFRMDASFLSSAREFALQRIGQSSSQRLKWTEGSSRRTSLIRMGAHVVGTISEHPPRFAALAESLYFEPRKGAGSTGKSHSSLIPMELTLRDDYVDWHDLARDIWNANPALKVIFQKFTAKTDIHVPTTTRPGDIIMTLNVMGKPLVIARQISNTNGEYFEIIGGAVVSWNANAVLGHCYACSQRRSCEGSLEVRLHPDDFLNLAVSQNAGLNYLCLPFSTPATASFATTRRPSIRHISGEPVVIW